MEKLIADSNITYLDLDINSIYYVIYTCVNIKKVRM